ncbi:MAG: S-methyl-5'-thioadenosine phosphorylase [Gammaproteobacteria bacterium]
MTNETAEIGIIGGTGVYDPGMLENAKQVKVYTPFGAPSDLITVGTFAGRRVAFLPRHGMNHTYAPHPVPYRANIWAFKELGVTRIIAPAAVGSLRENVHPGDIVVVDQFFDFTKGRHYTFYEGGQVCHISVAEPMCPELRELSIDVLKKMKVKFHEKGTNVCIQGPRYSSRAESNYFRDNIKEASVIGMTLVPECVLAREAEICYLSLAAVTDYDSWSNKPVDTASVKKVMTKNLAVLREAIKTLIPQIPTEREKCPCPTALQDAMI